MNIPATPLAARTQNTVQLVTFHCGDLLLGIDIARVQEINRELDITPVPDAPAQVRGAINLRGDVVTVIDLGVVLGVQATPISTSSRNLIVHFEDELIGLLTDGRAETVVVRESEIARPPANVQGVDGRFFRGVYSESDQLIVILDLDETLALRGAA